jgi:hypothetical protein
MATMAAILEDDAARVAEMRRCLRDLLPNVESVFFDDANEMIIWLGRHIGEVALISLDHDLPLKGPDGQVIDCGNGRQVADFIASLPPTCPVIVHSSNLHCAPGMFFALKEAGWRAGQVYPHEDLVWIEGAWAAQA